MKKRWTKKDEIKLKNNIELTNIELGELLGRTPMSVSKKKARLGLTLDKERWSKEDDEILIDLLGTHTNKEIGKILGRSAGGVKSRYTYIGLGESDIWTEEEDDIIISKWDMYSVKRLSEILGRSEGAVTRRAWLKGLGKRYNRGGYYLTTGDVGMILGISRSTVRNKINSKDMKARMYGKNKIAQISPENMIEYLEKNICKMDEEKVDWDMVKIYYISDINNGEEISTRDMIEKIYEKNRNYMDE